MMQAWKVRSWAAVLGTAVVAIGGLLGAQAPEPPQLGKAPLEQVIAAMTLEEKVHLVVGTGMRIPGMQQQGPAVGETQELVPGAAGTTYAIPRLGIPPIVLADGPAGLRIQPKRPNDPNTYYCTAFPVATLIASSWDPALARRVGEAMGNEVLEYGVDVILGPGMNIHRNPLCGRNFEYYSEDPLLSGKMAAAAVQGIQSQGVGTSIKHFVANNQEWNRFTVNEHITPRAMREIYLEGFRIAVVEAQPWTVMSSYNKVNGVYTSQRPDLLETILRGEWWFRGLVMTDWFAGDDAIAQQLAGNDLLMPGVPQQREALLQAVREGRLDEKILDRNVERILRIVLRSPRFRGYPFSNRPDLAGHARVAREAAAEAMVLLKNEASTLPLRDAGKKLALFGVSSYETYIGGTGSGDVNEAYSVSIRDGLKNAGYTLLASVDEAYAKYIPEAKEKLPRPRSPFFPLPPVPEWTPSAEDIQAAAEGADVAVVTIGRLSGEFGDREVDGDFTLKPEERQLLQQVADAFHAQNKPLVVILNIGGVIETVSWRDLADAILVAWQPGQEAGNAVADVVTGKVTPSGKLPMTFPVRYEDVPSAKYYPGRELPQEAGASFVPAGIRGKPAEATYGEDIFVGYRYYTTFDVPVAYEFGFGMSYTTFEYRDLQVQWNEAGERLEVSCVVRNNGSAPGREVVQLYVSGQGANLYRPERVLVGFGKTRLLAPGAEEKMTFTVDARRLSAFSEAAAAWILEPGTYTLRVGASSQDIRLEQSFRVERYHVTEPVHDVLKLDQPIDVLRP
ncbi:MAG: beta-glucosidase [Acidobacteriota bacterium]